MTENTEQEQDSMSYYSGKIQKRVVGRFMNKSDFIDNETEVRILRVGKGKFNDFITFKYNDEEVNLSVSKTNLNNLIDMLGDDLTKWKDKPVKLNATFWEGDIDGEHKQSAILKFYE